MPTISVSGQLPSSNAGEINIELRDSHDSTIEITGSHTASISYYQKIALSAAGANGIDGKIGADGYNGTRGIHGESAERDRRGTNGGRGGDGGHGEAGSDGTAAGNGGTIDVRVKHEDIALLDSISSTNVSAGVAGKAGRHGAGGIGGPGGHGGIAYSESEPYSIERDVLCMDAQGNMHTHTIRSNHYRNYNSAGGSKGQDGSAGGAYTYPLHPGAEGTAGRLHFHVTGKTEESLHTEPYKLQTQNVSFESAEKSGFWEPGDLIKASYEVENKGSTMASPPEFIPLVLENEDHVELVQPGGVAGNIQPGAKHFSGPTPLQFRIKQPKSHTGNEPYTLSATVRVGALNARLHQAFQHSTTSNTLSVQYPVLLEPQATHFTIAKEETLLLQATVKNIGAKAIGKDAGRALVVEITAADAKSSLVSEDVSLLKPQETQQITHKEQFKPGTELGEQHTYYMSLFLQPIDRSDTKVLIQRQSIIGQFTAKYAPTKNKFTLVINANTTKEQIKYWMDFLGQLSGNSELAIWNTAYYQGLNLDGTPCLLEDTRHGTLIILDDLFPSKPSNEPRHNTQYLTQEQLLKASQIHDVSLVALGKQELIKPYRNSDQVFWPNYKQTYDSMNRLMEQLIHERIDKSLVLHQITLPLQRFWFSRKKERAEDVLALVINSLKKVFPNRTYHVSIANTDGLQVTLHLRRLADTLDQNMHQISLSDRQIAEPKKHQDIIQNGIIGALPFSQKLELFIQKSNPYHKHLAQAIAKDLLDEQNRVMQTEAYGSWLQRILRTNQRDFTLELKKLSQLLHQLEQFVLKRDFENVQAWSPLVIRLIAQVQYHAKQHSSFWTRFIHWFLPQTNEQIIECINVLCDKVLNLQSAYSNTPIQEIKASVQREEALLNLADELMAFLKNQDAISLRNGYHFFTTSSINDAQALKQLYCVCAEGAALETLDSCLLTLKHSIKLEPFLRKFKKLFPEFVLKETNDVGSGLLSHGLPKI